MVSRDSPWGNLCVRVIDEGGIEGVWEINVLFLLKFYLHQFMYSYYNNDSIT